MTNRPTTSLESNPSVETEDVVVSPENMAETKAKAKVHKDTRKEQEALDREVVESPLDRVATAGQDLATGVIDDAANVVEGYVNVLKEIPPVGARVIIDGAKVTVVAIESGVIYIQDGYVLAKEVVIDGANYTIEVVKQIPEVGKYILVEGVPTSVEAIKDRTLYVTGAISDGNRYVLDGVTYALKKVEKDGLGGFIDAAGNKIEELFSKEELSSRDVEEESQALLEDEFGEYLKQNPEVQGLLDEAGEIETRIEQSMQRVLDLSPNLKELMDVIASGKATESQKVEYIGLMEKISDMPGIKQDQEAYEKVFKALQGKGLFEWFTEKKISFGEWDGKEQANILKGAAGVAFIPSFLTFVLSEKKGIGGRLVTAGGVGLGSTLVLWGLMQKFGTDKTALTHIANGARVGIREGIIKPADGFSRLVDNGMTDFLNLLGGDGNFNKLRGGSINLPILGEVHGGSAGNAREYLKNQYFLERFEFYPMAVQQVLGDYLVRGDVALNDPTNIDVVAQYVHRAEHLVRPTTSMDQKVVGNSLDRQALPVSFSVKELKRLFGPSVAYQKAYLELENNESFQPRYTDTVKESDQYLYGETVYVEANRDGTNPEYQQALRDPKDVLVDLYKEFSDRDLDWVSESGKIDSTKQPSKEIANRRLKHKKKGPIDETGADKIKEWIASYENNQRIMPQFEKKTLLGHILKIWARLTISLNGLFVSRNIIHSVSGSVGSFFSGLAFWKKDRPKSPDKVEQEKRTKSREDMMDLYGYATVAGGVLKHPSLEKEISYKKNYSALCDAIRTNNIVLSKNDYNKMYTHWSSKKTNLSKDQFNQDMGIDIDEWNKLWNPESGDPFNEYKISANGTDIPVQYKDGPHKVITSLRQRFDAEYLASDSALESSIKNMLEHAFHWSKHPEVIRNTMHGSSEFAQEWYDFDAESFLKKVREV